MGCGGSAEHSSLNECLRGGGGSEQSELRARARGGRGWGHDGGSEIGVACGRGLHTGGGVQAGSGLCGAAGEHLPVLHVGVLRLRVRGTGGAGEVPSCARPGRARARAKKKISAETCLRPVVAGSAFCALCKCMACPKHNSQRTRYCFTKSCETHNMPRPGHSRSEAEAEASVWSTAAYCNMHGRQSLPEAWPPSLKVAAKLGWLLVQNTPLDYLLRLEFADALAVRRADFVVHCADVAWLFMAHCIKWPVAVSRFHEHALRACDARAGTAAAIVDALVRVLRDLSGQAFPKMHARMSSKGRMHSSTGIIVHAQWLGLLCKLDVGSQAAAGDVVLKLGVSQSAYVLKPCQDDAVQLVATWLATIRQEWPRQVNTASFADSADAMAQTVARLRSMSEGSAGRCIGSMPRARESAGCNPAPSRRSRRELAPPDT